MVWVTSRTGRSIAFVLILATSAAAAEMATDAERSYRELRDSSDRATQMLGRRWYGLVQLQEWTDDTGKFKTQAKYVEHDPALEWVKLRVIRGTGNERIVKDVEVPVERLNAACRSRVRQIAVLASKVAEAVTAERQREREEEAGADGRGGMQDGGIDPRAGFDADFGADGGVGRGLQGERDPRAEMMRQDPRGSDPRAAQITAPAMSNSNQPLPAMLPPLPGGVLGRSGPAVAGAEGGEQVVVEPANLPDDAAWRTSYDAFRKNISVTYDRGAGLSVNFGELQALQALYSQEQERRELEQTGQTAPTPPETRASELAALGEFQWESTLASDHSPSAEWAATLGLAPLADPVKLMLILDEEKGPGNWQSLKAGDNVRFVGRFVGFEENFVIVAAIRFLDLPTTGAGPPAYPR